MKLWGNHNDISLWMLFSEGDETLAERLVLFLVHPEHLNHSKFTPASTVIEPERYWKLIRHGRFRPSTTWKGI